ncbi:hypothetical protein V1511DRAFT_500886 [Dipodascopsis uninucleata]
MEYLSRPTKPPIANGTEIISRKDLFHSSESSIEQNRIKDTKELNYDITEASEKVIEIETKEVIESNDLQQSEVNELSDSQEFEFSLFSSSPKKIKLDDRKIIDNISEGTTQIFNHKVDNTRPRSYYMVDSKDEIRKGQIVQSAISGEDVISQSTATWFAMKMPWRVTHITLRDQNNTKKQKRKKPSKKRRLILKLRAAKKQAVQERTSQFKDGHLSNWRFYNLKSSRSEKRANLQNDNEKQNRYHRNRPHKYIERK